MKKFFTSKPFLVTALIVSCLAVAAVCLYLNLDRGTEFVPEPSQQGEYVGGWKENGGGAGDAKPPATAPNPTQEQAAYPKIVAEDDGNVVIDFTPPQSSEAEAPEVPAGQPEIEKPQQKSETSHPVNPDPSVKPPESKPQTPSGPAPGSTNSKGQVYDPVFGWVDLSPAEQIPTDNDGDPNKAVGSMD
ncbi:DUF6550 family protein [Sporomusa sphaeroides]|uniref:DUF6550 family protein n=1 Tax=Sporomusa sphaeroides TaxID=47679 RepID=UPI002B978F0C|nr:DUF6550 family protein [Sporomusa sphaeroides]HML33402.1 hypothetical protein [Sporomusa sphaeroides]